MMPILHSALLWRIGGGGGVLGILASGCFVPSRLVLGGGGAVWSCGHSNGGDVSHSAESVIPWSQSSRGVSHHAESVIPSALRRVIKQRLIAYDEWVTGDGGHC